MAPGAPTLAGLVSCCYLNRYPDAAELGQRNTGGIRAEPSHGRRKLLSLRLIRVRANYRFNQYPIIGSINTLCPTYQPDLPA
jgi:hypothetical protein